MGQCPVFYSSMKRACPNSTQPFWRGRKNPSLKRKVPGLRAKENTRITLLPFATHFPYPNQCIQIYQMPIDSFPILPVYSPLCPRPILSKQKEVILWFCLLCTSAPNIAESIQANKQITEMYFIHKRSQGIVHSILLEVSYTT